eukprot:4968791-Prymnesium_polylepis.1
MPSHAEAHKHSSDEDVLQAELRRTLLEALRAVAASPRCDSNTARLATPTARALRLQPLGLHSNTARPATPTPRGLRLRHRAACDSNSAWLVLAPQDVDRNPPRCECHSNRLTDCPLTGPPLYGS